MAKTQKIKPFLWFNNEAEEAANFYLSVFKNASLVRTTRPGGQVVAVNIKLEGQEFTLLNGGPKYKFTEAVSFVVNCKTQKEVDYYWEKLTADGGQESACGWLKDKYGLSWQIIPDALIAALNHQDANKAQTAMSNMLNMRKIVVRNLLKPIKTVRITVKTSVNASLTEVWEKFTLPKHIMQWNQASPDWHCPSATSDLQAGGAFSYTMAAKDGSFSFDLTGTFDVVKQHELLEYTLSDGRKVVVQFRQKGKKVEVIETFEAENMHPHEMQKGGWQAILDSFKGHCES